MASRTIEITTTQNVIIEYKLAGLRYRLLAFLLDWLFIGLLIGLGIFINHLVMYDPAANDFYIILFVILFYGPLSELLGQGRTYGKKFTHLQVIKMDGSAPTTEDLLIRWTFRLIDIILTFGSIAALFISATRKGQRLGDVIANTTVIQLKDEKSLSYADLLKIRNTDTHQISYPAVRSMSEQEMMIIKNVLDRFKKHPNNAHGEATKLCAEVMIQRLQIQERITDPIPFLRTLINDYIVLTR